MSCSHYVYLFFFSTYFFSCQSAHTIRKCKRQDPDFQDCFAIILQDVLVHSNKPQPEFGLPSYEPYVMSKLTLAIDHGLVHLSEKLNSLVFHGFTYAKVQNLRLDINAKTIYMTFFMSNCTLEANFEVKGTALEESVDFRGKLRAEYLDTSLDFSAKLGFYNASGREYIKVMTSETKWKPGKATERVVSENKIETAHLQKMFDEHYAEIFKDSEKVYEKVFNDIIAKALNILWSTIPDTELF